MLCFLRRCITYRGSELIFAASWYSWEAVDGLLVLEVSYIIHPLLWGVATPGKGRPSSSKADMISNFSSPFYFLLIEFGVSPMDRVRNEEVRRRTGIERELAIRADQRVLRWFGHVNNG